VLDLVDMQQHSIQNDGYRYMLTCIDTFSKMAWAVAMKDKGGKSICDAFRQILQGGRKPYRVRTDKGKEFVNMMFKKLLEEEAIHFFTSQKPLVRTVVPDRRTVAGTGRFGNQ